jgi:hypothetical protein
MANMIYPLMIFIFVFGAVSSYVTESQLYNFDAPKQGVETNVTEIREVNDAMLQSSKASGSGFSQVEWFYILGKSVLGGAFAVLTLGPLLQSYGIPVGMVGFIISPLGIVLAFYLIEYWLGRPSE